MILLTFEAYFGCVGPPYESSNPLGIYHGLSKMQLHLSSLTLRLTLVEICHYVGSILFIIDRSGSR